MTGRPSADDVAAALTVARAVADAVRELGEVPAGHLYAALMGKISLETFDRVLGVLQRAGLVRRTPGHLVVWTGPK